MPPKSRRFRLLDPAGSAALPPDAAQKYALEQDISDD
jgi:hypothetical protein